jgi:hypothetical protein
MREAGLKTIVWVGTVIILSTLLAGSAAGSIQADKSVSQIESANVTVGPQESVQEAIDRAEVGDTVSIPEGTYTQSVDIDKGLTLKGTGEVILDGNSLGDVDGISVTSNDVTIKNITVRRFTGTGISITGDSVLTRGITIQDVTSRLNGNSGLYVTDATDNSELIIKNSRFTENGFKGVNTNGEFNTIKISNVDTNDNDDGGMDLRGSTVIVRDSKSLRNDGEGGFDDDNPQHGIDINRASEVVVEDSILRDNRGYNLNIDEIDQPLTRNVNITNVIAERNKRWEGVAYAGIAVGSATENDVINLTNVSVQESSYDGISLNAKKVYLNDVNSNKNSDRGIAVTADTVSINDVDVIENNGEGGFDDDVPQHGIDISQANEVTIKDTNIRDSRGNNIHIDENSDNQPLTRNVNITNVTSTRTLRWEGGSYTGIYVDSATQNDVINLTNVSVSESAFDGISLNAKKISLKNIISSNNYDNGIDVTGTAVNITDVRVTSNNGEARFDENENQHGIDISQAESIEINNAFIRDSRGNQIRIEENSDNKPLNRNIDISNVTANRTDTIDGAGQTGIYIEAGTESETINLSNISVKGSTYKGIAVNGETISLKNVNSNNNDDTGIDLTGTVVDIDNVEAMENNGEAGFSEDVAQHGIDISQAEDIHINDIVLERNRGNNLKIDESADNRPIERNITIDDLTSRETLKFDGSGYTGIFIDDAVEEGAVYISNTTVQNSKYDGISLDISDINIEDSTFANNNNNGMYIESEEADIRNSTIDQNDNIGVVFESVKTRALLRNSSITGGGLLVQNNAGVEIDARKNWWGSAGGADDKDIEGSVDVSQPLSSSPGEQSDSSDEKRISQDVRVTSPQLIPSEVSSASQTRHNLTFNLQNISSDDKRDNLTIKMPESVKIENVNEVSIDNTRYGYSRSGNTISVSVNPDGAEDNVDLPVRVELILTKTD